MAAILEGGTGSSERYSSMKTLYLAVAYGWLPVAGVAVMIYVSGVVVALQVLGFMAFCLLVSVIYACGVVLVGRMLAAQTTDESNQQE